VKLVFLVGFITKKSFQCIAFRIQLIMFVFVLISSKEFIV